jgi:hypothetical protein
MNLVTFKKGLFRSDRGGKSTKMTRQTINEYRSRAKKIDLKIGEAFLRSGFLK